MAERIVSPGVFTNEIDQSFLPAAVSEIGAALIGISSKGPAFVPTVVESYSDFKVKFGGLNKDYFLPYAAKSYLKNAGKCTIVRVLGTGGSTITNPVIIRNAAGGTTATATSSLTWDVGATGSVGDFVAITGSDGTVYRFIADEAPLPPNTSTDFYFDAPSGSVGDNAPTVDEQKVNLAGFVTSMSVAINAASIGVTTSTGSDGSTYGGDAATAGTGCRIGKLTLTASNAGADFNSIGFNTGSLYNNKAFGTLAVQAVGTSTNHFIGSGTAGSPNLVGGSDASNATVLAAVFATGSDATKISALGAGHLTDCGGGAATLGNFCLEFKATATGTPPSSQNTPTMSLHSGDSNYIANVLGTQPGGASYHGYLKFIFKNSADNLASTTTISSTNEDNTFGQYMSAKTPSIVSQTGSNAEDVTSLFKFETLSSGYASNKFVKVAFSNIKPTANSDVTEYGQFDVIIRDFNDTDKKQVIVESYPSVNLDPTSPNFIVRRIGDMKETFNTGTGKIDVTGDYPVKSKYVRIDTDSIAPQLKDGTLSPSILPYGFKHYNFPAKVESSDFGVSMPIRTNMSESGEFQSKFFHGLAFDSASKYDLHPYFDAVPTTTAGGTSFISQIATGSYSGSSSVFTLDGIHGLHPTDASLNTKKFILGFQGGEDGFDPVEVSEKHNGLGHAKVGNSDGNANFTDFKNAISSVENPDEIDINMLAIPGLNMIDHTLLYGKSKTLVEERQDCFLVFDTGGKNATKAQVISQVEAEDNNYVATYYPWVKIFDDENNQYTWVPPSTIIPGVVAFTDKVSHPWFAPAGLNRGGLTEVVMAKDRLTQAERDDLYEARVNPIATFPGQGVCVWGQKTLQAKPSALDRVNVRRLLITLKKFIASTSKFLVFEQNNAALRQRFLNIVQPYLEGVQQKAGLTSFKVVVDDTVNTADVIDRNELRGNIYLKPTRTAEFIVLDFVVMGSGAVFPE
tara:strand:+ start:6924 stop:9821 length:2898 start_codon:yes stop_codon:yes gene_type:complete